MTLAILCSGQGTQHAQMFALTGEAPQASALFAQAKVLLGEDPRDLVRSSQPGALHTNRTGQILCTLQPLAAAAALDRLRTGRRIVAGYSVGEVPAWSLAGLIAPERALDLVAQRARCMDAASEPGDGLAFVRGLSRAIVEALCREHGLEIAIVNPDNAFVVGGGGAALDGFVSDAGARGAERIVRLDVRVASHTSKLAAASAEFRSLLPTCDRQRPPAGVRLLSGIDATFVGRIGAGLDKLGAQISTPVQWSDCLTALREAGATACLECGPGSALARMVGTADPALPVRSLEDFRSLDGVAAWLTRVAPDVLTKRDVEN